MGTFPICILNSDKNTNRNVSFGFSYKMLLEKNVDKVLSDLE
jgi:hypothetical protein